ncbi:aspartate/glutamate racemase family protein [Glaciecola sp. HTCC2999]|uniref:aspartate/glutamate racemase family protein n=1 Tax=Glaciecola sp. HTCC2999 TaxID=455436 RepID=UPI0000E0E655|nr:aspartate/glutamate racemase family protein [Glaciecola sp. HTCC2999]
MRVIGLIGGMSWESTATYYQLINEGVKMHLGGLHSAQIRLHSVDFAEIAALQSAGDWSQMGEILVNAAQSLAQAGADSIVICTNTMHKLAPDIAAQVNIPLLHIADATGQALVEQGIKQVGLLGTRFTMEQDFYASRLLNKYGIEVITPDQTGRDAVHQIIYEELCLGHIHTQSRSIYQHVVAKLADQGAQAVILGCTEIGLLLQQSDTPVPLFDTTHLHAQMAVRFALS